MEPCSRQVVPAPGSEGESGRCQAHNRRAPSFATCLVSVYTSSCPSVSHGSVVACWVLPARALHRPAPVCPPAGRTPPSVPSRCSSRVRRADERLTVIHVDRDGDGLQDLFVQGYTPVHGAVSTHARRQPPHAGCAEFARCGLCSEGMCAWLSAHRPAPGVVSSWACISRTSGLWSQHISAP